MATNDEMDVKKRMPKGLATPRTYRTAPIAKPSYRAAVPLSVAIGTGAAAGASTGPAAPLAIPILATLGAGYGLYLNRRYIMPLILAAYNKAAGYFDADEAPAAGTAAPALPAPTDTTTTTSPAPPTTASNGSTPTSNPEPEPEPKRGLWKRIKRAAAELRGKGTESSRTTSTPSPRPSRGWTPFTGYSNGSFFGNTVRVLRDWLTATTGVDAIDNAAGAIGERVYPDRESSANWNLTKNWSPLGIMMQLSTTPRTTPRTAPIPVLDSDTVEVLLTTPPSIFLEGFDLDSLIRATRPDGH